MNCVPIKGLSNKELFYLDFYRVQFVFVLGEGGLGVMHEAVVVVGNKKNGFALRNGIEIEFLAGDYVIVQDLNVLIPVISGVLMEEP